MCVRSLLLSDSSGVLLFSRNRLGRQANKAALQESGVDASADENEETHREREAQIRQLAEEVDAIVRYAADVRQVWDTENRVLPPMQMQ